MKGQRRTTSVSSKTGLTEVKNRRISKDLDLRRKILKTFLFQKYPKKNAEKIWKEYLNSLRG